MKTIDYISIGEKIRKARIDAGLSQQMLADLCGISLSFLGHIERGSRKMSLETLVSIANALNLSCDYLLMDELPENDAVIQTIANTAKKHGSYQYERFLTIMKALAEISDTL